MLNTDNKTTQSPKTLTNEIIAKMDVVSMSATEIDRLLVDLKVVESSQLKSIPRAVRSILVSSEIEKAQLKVKKNSSKRSVKSTRSDQNYGLIVSLFRTLIDSNLIQDLSFGSDRQFCFLANHELVEKIGALDGSVANNMLIYPSTDMSSSYKSFGMIIACKFGLKLKIEPYAHTDGKMISFNPSTASGKKKLAQFCELHNLSVGTDELKAIAYKKLTQLNQWKITATCCKSQRHFELLHKKHPTKTLETIEKIGGFVLDSHLKSRENLSVIDWLELAIEQSKNWNTADSTDVSDDSEK